MAQSYILQRLDELRTISQQTAEKVEELAVLLRALPAAAAMEPPPSLASRLQTWLQLLQPLSVMATKHLTTAIVVWYMATGGNPLTAAELLLKLL